MLKYFSVDYNYIFNRKQTVSGQTQVREQQNLITPYLDSGTVYGANQFQMDELLNRSSCKEEMKKYLNGMNCYETKLKFET